MKTKQELLRQFDTPRFFTTQMRDKIPQAQRFRKDFCWIYALLLEDVRTGFDLMVRRFGSVDFPGDV